MKNSIRKIYGAIVAAIMLASAVLPTGSAFAAKDINIDTANYGYGKYVVRARADGMDGVYDADVVTFYYLPAWAELVETDDGCYIDVHYVMDDGSDNPEGEVASVTIEIYDKDGKPVSFSPLSGEDVPLNSEGLTRVKLPFDEKGYLGPENYTIKVYAYDRNGTSLYDPYVFEIEYGKELPVPDTGIFTGINISKTDYLVTGLIIFGMIAVGGLVFIRQKG